MELKIGLSLILVFIVYCIICHFIDKRIKKIKYKVWIEGRKDIANNMINSSYWIKDNVELNNYLWLTAHSIKEFDHWDIDRIRKHIQQLGKTRVHDLPMEERKEYFPKK